MSGKIPIVYTIRGCKACVKLLEKWKADGLEYEERRAELSQATMDEARRHGSAVPLSSGPMAEWSRGLRGTSGATSSDGRVLVWLREQMPERLGWEPPDQEQAQIVPRPAADLVCARLAAAVVGEAEVADE